ncbi:MULTISPECIES: primase-helicase zinc-binding domain-containing protein [Cupriavidus]|uniref:P4 alpha zinc-binding domain protein n=1 Tax=Cupriavidus taiwanensis TaxID=164546 RepID=A0A7Z7NRM3_9BURK|nr:MULTISPECIES: primase-helicase zinc-binding domain-containing protein [Cupriavidus]NOV27757.1 zinc-binding protein [Cupriavidus necator]NSX13285.1 zinc-binding protein [Cupriavidus taiwanensis]SOZ18927.1 P4 alpha zinc-binding domain protein [Cupriavidus taiwanensis]SOZ97066.1 P4 alpha zinc-binding domain protein [Cupriavidus taiwanensis]SPC25880.1 P4 alpha zinc-binding domain protein [Cupriavidus taiwanensis]
MKQLSDIVRSWTPAQWEGLLKRYLPAEVLTDNFWQGRPGRCPLCGGHDRFTFDNKRGRGDWVCRKCNAGSPKAGDGLELVRCFTGLTYWQLKLELNGDGSIPIEPPGPARSPEARRKVDDPAAKMRRIVKKWNAAAELAPGDHAMRYLAARVPGLHAPRPSALRLAEQDYWHDGQIIGRYPTILAKFALPDGRMATVHRTSLDPSVPAKALIVSEDGEILPAKRNDVSALPLSGGAVRLMSPRAGEVGVAEGLESAYAAYMLFGVPTWNCLNRVLLSQFEVPPDLGIHTVHIFADFDQIDPATGKSPGMADALTLQKRLRTAGLRAVLHRPKIRGTDFCDQWRTEYQLRLMSRQAVAA